MDILYLLLIAVLTAVYFCVLLLAVKQKSYSFKTVRVKNDRNIEARLRLLMRKNPRSEIVVINNSTLDETDEILKKMEYDFPRIHIVSY